MAVEQERYNAELRRRVDIGLAVVDEHGVARFETVARQQNFVYAAFGFHGMFLTRNDLTVEKCVNAAFAEVVDELARHVGQNVKFVAGVFQILDKIAGPDYLLLHSYRRAHVPLGNLARAAVIFAQSVFRLLDSQRAAVVLLPERGHLRQRNEREKIDELLGTLSRVAGENHSAQIENDVFHTLEILCEDNVSGRKIQENRQSLTAQHPFSAVATSKIPPRHAQLLHGNFVFQNFAMKNLNNTPGELFVFRKHFLILYCYHQRCHTCFLLQIAGYRADTKT